MENVKERTSSALASIWPTQMGFVVSDNCFRRRQYFFKKDEEKQAIEKFEKLSRLN